MKFKTSIFFISFILIGFMGLQRASADSNDLEMLKKAKISLIRAIEIAQNDRGGQAYDAEIEDDSFNPEFEVKVTSSGKKLKYTIDGVSGEIIRVKEK